MLLCIARSGLSHNACTFPLVVCVEKYLPLPGNWIQELLSAFKYKEILLWSTRCVHAFMQFPSSLMFQSCCNAPFLISGTAVVGNGYLQSDWHIIYFEIVFWYVRTYVIQHYVCMLSSYCLWYGLHEQFCCFCWTCMLIESYTMSLLFCLLLDNLLLVSKLWYI